MSNYRYDHLHLLSPDPIKTAQFYETMFNAKRIAVRHLEDGRTGVEIDLNGLRLKINSPRVQSSLAPTSPATSAEPERLGIGTAHFGIRTDNIEASVAELKAKGGQFRGEIRLQQTGEKVSFLLAPENIAVELVERSD